MHPLAPTNLRAGAKMAVLTIITKSAAIGLVGKVCAGLALLAFMKLDLLLRSSQLSRLRAECVTLQDVWARGLLAGRQPKVLRGLIKVNERVLDGHVGDLLGGQRVLGSATGGHSGKTSQVRRSNVS